MKLICAILFITTSFSATCRTDVLRTLFLTEAPFHGEELDKEFFELNGELGVIYSSGNTTGTTLTTKLNGKQNLKNWYNRYTANILYRQSEREVNEQRELLTSAQRVFLSSQIDYKLNNPSERLFAYGEYEDDRFNAYKYQAAFALGWTEQLWSNEESELTYSVGPGYARSIAKQDTSAISQTGLIVRAALEYEKKLSDSAIFRQYLSTETDDDFSKSVSETSLSAKINGALAMKLSINMVHNRAPDTLDEPLDTQTSVTLVYQFF
ncbi:MAG: DUF481 domain-containing protein [Aliiglaciecola sp.]|uniref:DUF481 domain-containing protein n=1 Tax=Aliiglaciecola sp. M165 TaxID=2593649 RepID=UPI00117ED81F|nr:DUF481 domain-containing protein [Aliiglaciecola sp. M165]TRY30628.1 DUF481 domain-containing protein [Aliiglaciecola sp. M165]